MEFTALITLRSPEMILRLSRAKLPEVLGCLGNDICEEFELDSAQGLSCSLQKRQSAFGSLI